MTERAFSKSDTDHKSSVSLGREEGKPDSARFPPTAPCIFEDVNFHFLKFLGMSTHVCSFGKGSAVKYNETWQRSFRHRQARSPPFRHTPDIVEIMTKTSERLQHYKMEMKVTETSMKEESR